MADSEPERSALTAAKEFIKRRYSSQADVDRRLYSAWYQSAGADELRTQGKAVPVDFFFYIKYQSHYPWVTTSLLTFKLLQQ